MNLEEKIDIVCSKLEDLPTKQFVSELVREFKNINDELVRRFEEELEIRDNKIVDLYNKIAELERKSDCEYQNPS